MPAGLRELGQEQVQNVNGDEMVLQMACTGIASKGPVYISSFQAKKLEKS